jgi:hypothetical protein
MKPMDLLVCHIELLTQLVDLLARDHVETYMYSSSKPYGHINKTSGPTYRNNGHACNPTNLFIDPMDLFTKPMELFINLMDILGPIVIKLITQ